MEMQRRGLNYPFLIGGATTSKQHTAVKIAPAYAQPVVHVVDASRVVGVMSALLDEPRKAKLDADNRKDQERLRKLHEEKLKIRSCRTARRSRTASRWTGGRRTLLRPRSSAPGPSSRTSRSLRDYIDWTFFFTAWELKGSYPQILDHPKMGETARELFQVGQEVLDRIVEERLLEARGVYGYFPARADGDDIVLEGGWVFHCLRQQADRGEGEPNKSIADLVAPARIRCAGPRGRLRRLRRLRRRRAREDLRGRARRLPGDRGESTRRPPRRGVRRAASTSRSGASGTRPTSSSPARS